MWELALLLVAVTYMMVNTLAAIVQLKMIKKYDVVLDKSLKIIGKMMDNSEKFIDEMFDDFV